MPLKVDGDENFLNNVVDHRLRQASRIVGTQSDGDLRQQSMVRLRVPILSGSHHGVPGPPASFRSGPVLEKVVIYCARPLMSERNYRACQEPLHPRVSHIVRTRRLNCYNRRSSKAALSAIGNTEWVLVEFVWMRCALPGRSQLRTVIDIFG